MGWLPFSGRDKAKEPVGKRVKVERIERYYASKLRLSDAFKVTFFHKATNRDVRGNKKVRCQGLDWQSFVRVADFRNAANKAYKDHDFDIWIVRITPNVHGNTMLEQLRTVDGANEQQASLALSEATGQADGLQVRTHSTCR